MRKKCLSLMILIGFTTLLTAQTSNEPFKPGGKPLVTIFTDFKYNIQDNHSDPAFELTRAYFGYAYNFSPNFSSKVVFDVANKAGLSPSAYTAFLKNAYVEYADGLVKVSLGMIGTNTFKLQESTWGKRYLLKSFQDLNGFSSSADLGASVQLKLTPQISLDAQVVNGEGYSKVQADSTFKVAVGLTAEPVKHVYVRVYGDYMKKNVAQSTINAFVGYVGDKLTLAGEYNLQIGHAMVKDQNYSGLSVYGTYKVNNTMAAFGRFDDLTSKKLVGGAAWNALSDGQLYTAGLEFLPVKGVSISPNVQYKNPVLSALKPSTSLFLSVGLNF